MSKCAVTNCQNENLVFSGVDALMLGGIPTEKYCYPCAVAYTLISNDIESMVKL